MPTFIVTVLRTKIEKTEITVIKAKDDDAAGQTAIQLAENKPEELEWELEDETLDIEEVSEE